MTINSWNVDEVTDVAEFWKSLADGINFQIHTPFMENDPLWIPYGKKRDELIDKIILLKRKYPQYVIHEEKQLNLFIDRVKENYKPEVVDYKEDENIVFKVPNFLN